MLTTRCTSSSTWTAISNEPAARSERPRAGVSRSKRDRLDAAAAPLHAPQGGRRAPGAGGPYSDRRAIDGSTRAARKAGTQHAIPTVFAFALGVTTLSGLFIRPRL